MYHRPTRHILCHMYTKMFTIIYQTSTRYLSDVWYMSGVNVVFVWQMSGWSWQVSDEASGSHLTSISQSSEREHQTNSNCLAETVEYQNMRKFYLSEQDLQAVPNRENQGIALNSESRVLSIMDFRIFILDDFQLKLARKKIIGVTHNFLFSRITGRRNC